MIAGAGVRTGLGGDSAAEARESMKWHRDHNLWLTSKTWDNHWDAGLVVIAAQSGGHAKFMRGVALDSDTLDNTGRGRRGHYWDYAKRVAWDPQTFLVPPVKMCEPIERLLRIRNLTWFDEDELEQVLSSLVEVR
jgi:hypothetical protein